MTLQQTLAFALLGAAIVVFVWGRWRYDLVALVTLLAGVVLHVVPAKEAFSGFSNDIVVIIASALVISAAIGKSGIVEAALRPLLVRLKREPTQVPAMVLAVTLLSMVTKNIGALAIFMPIAGQLAKRSGGSLSNYLMPMAFGSLLGGVVTLVGTSPNIIVSQVRAEELGRPFGMFDYTPVGLWLALGGALFLSVFYRMIPKGRRAPAGLEEALEAAPYVTEARAPFDWTEPRTVADLHAMADGGARVIGLLREGERRKTPLPDTVIAPGETVILQGEQAALDKLIDRAGLKLGRGRKETPTEGADDEVRVTEAVIGPRSVLRGQSARSIGLFERYGVNLIAVGRADERITERPRSVTLNAGDVVVLQGASKQLPAVLRDLGCLPLAERDLRLGAASRKYLPVALLTLAMLLVAAGVVPVAVAFVGAAVAMVAGGSLSLREAYRALDAPVLVLIAALIPISDAVRVTGGTELVAHQLAPLMAGLPGWAGIAIMILAAMAVTPFLNNAATVLVMAPIAMSLAKLLGLNPDAFLMAVAIGAACDFLTPIGHQCNTLVMGPGGYRFGDYARLGAPLSLFVLTAGTPLIAHYWPLHAG